jgi:hypothetical protein
MAPFVRAPGLLTLCHLLLFLALPVAAATDFCVMTKPTTCSNTSWLSWSPGFATAVKKFIGQSKVNYFRSAKALSWQALYGLGGPPQERLSLPDNRYLFGACPAHDCGGQASAIILDDDGSIEAIGFSSFHCCESNTILDRRYLDLYVKRGASADTVITELKSWLIGSVVTSMLSDPRVDDGIDSRIAVNLLN